MSNVISYIPERSMQKNYGDKTIMDNVHGHIRVSFDKENSFNLLSNIFFSVAKTML